MYLKRVPNSWSNRFSFYKVERETKSYYFVRVNDKCVAKVYKKYVGFGHEWSVPTEEDFKKYKIRCLAGKLESLIKATDFEKWSEEKLKSLIATIQQGGADGEGSTGNPDDRS